MFATNLLSEFPFGRLSLVTLLLILFLFSLTEQVAFTWGHVLGAFPSSIPESQQRASAGCYEDGCLSTRNLLSSVYRLQLSLGDSCLHTSQLPLSPNVAT